MPTAAGERIGGFVHLKKKPKAQEALLILRRVAAHVLPIMQSRGWRVTTLAEFFPTQTNLLGTNYGKGRKISLRLRPHYNDGEFMPFEDVVGTMLHELTHNAFGPHDAKFYALLDDLNLEYDTLRAKGFKGDDGDALGGRVLSIADAKKAASARAVRASRGTGSDGKILGGGALTLSNPQDVRSRVAQAAQRRLHDAKWCGHGHAQDPILVDEEEETTNDRTVDRDPSRRPILNEEINLESSMQQGRNKESDTIKSSEVPVEIIEITSDEDVSASSHLKPGPSVAKKRSYSRDVTVSDDYQRMKSRGLIADTLYDHLKKLKSSSSPKLTEVSESNDVRLFVPSDKWQCEVCTLINPLVCEQCSACEAQRPGKCKRGEYWICECQMSNEWNTWMCSRCQRIKRSS